MTVALLTFALAISVVPPTAGNCADPIGPVQEVNRTYRLIPLCWNDKSSGTHSYQVNVHCWRGKETLVVVSDVISQSVNLILECGYYCNASVRTNNLDGSHYNTPLPAFGTTDALTPIVRSTDTAPNDTTSVTIIIESAEGSPLYCGAPQSVGLMWQQLEHAIVYTNWTWHNGDIVLSLHNVTYCDLPLNVSVYYTTHGSMSSSKGPGTVRPKPLDAPAIIGAVVQDSALTVVFSDTAQCSNSSWEVCVTVDGQHQTERCSSRSAEDRSMTVDDAGKGNVYSVRARVLYGDRHSPYSETTSLDATSVLPRDQLSLSNIGLPDVRLCYAVNLPILRKATSLPKPKQFVVHYKLCGSIDERINNLSVTESCVDLQGWPGGCCYEVRLFLTLDIDGFEISLNTTTVHQGPVLPLISLAAIPVVMIIIGCLLCAAWAKRSRNLNKANYRLQPEDWMSPEWHWDPETIEPDIPSEFITIGSEFGNNDDEDHPGDAEFDNRVEPLNTQHDSQVADRDYAYASFTLSPSRSACTSTSVFTSSSGISEHNVRFYSKEPSLLNFGSGE